MLLFIINDIVIFITNCLNITNYSIYNNVIDHYLNFRILIIKY